MKKKTWRWNYEKFLFNLITAAMIFPVFYFTIALLIEWGFW